MKDQYVSLEVAQLAKAKEFDWTTRVFWSRNLNRTDSSHGVLGITEFPDVGDIPCPTQSLLQKWLREVHYLHLDVQPNAHFCWQVRVLDLGHPQEVAGKLPSRTSCQDWLTYDYPTYEEAVEAGLTQALTLLP